jgi:hypothetical protein
LYFLLIKLPTANFQWGYEQMQRKKQLDEAKAQRLLMKKQERLVRMLSDDQFLVRSQLMQLIRINFYSMHKKHCARKHLHRL